VTINRRSFIQSCSLFITAHLFGKSKETLADENMVNSHNQAGVLVDTTLCIGCRKCEWACKNINQLAFADMESFNDDQVLADLRRTSADSYTVVNQYEDVDETGDVHFIKIQCMHCIDAACVSACPIGALKRDPDTGAVVYDKGKCIGCRYCMIACPFDIPCFEYDEPLTAGISKCTFCLDRLQASPNNIPACVEICPVEALIFGKREKLVEIAKRRIYKYPNRYFDHIYGLHEAGGTAWIYLTDINPRKLGLKEVTRDPVPATSHNLLKSMFNFFLTPASMIAVLASIRWLFRPRELVKSRNEEINE